MIREKIIELVAEISSLPPDGFQVERPINNLGDYAVNAAFVLAKQAKENPISVAQNLVEKIKAKGLEEFNDIQAVNGYINFFLSPAYLQKQLAEINQDKNFGQSRVGKGKTIIIEYSQPNIAKKMHLGHLRTTILGNALANIYETGGYKVIRWNYLGDWGTQFGKLIAAYKLWGQKEAVEQNLIDTLQALYVRFHEELKTNPELEKRGQEEFKKLEAGDQENHRLWQWFRNESLKEFEKMYNLLGIKFDTDIGESFYQKDLVPLIKELEKEGIATESEGALLINLDKQGLPPALIRKSDGASLYLTRDIANLKYRLKQYEPEQILYVVANEQALVFEQLFAVAKLIGLTQAQLVHVKYGLVLGEDKKKLATREGRTVSAEEVITKTVGLAREIVESKNHALPETEKTHIAETVGIAAIKYELLKEHRNTDVVFNWKRMLDFSGNSGPYLQYTFARLSSILEKAAALKSAEADLGKLSEKKEFAIIKHLLEFPTVIEQSRWHNLTNPLALYLFELANLANSFYESTPVLTDADEGRLAARLVLIATTTEILQRGLALLGIRTLNRI